MPSEAKNEADKSKARNDMEVIVNFYSGELKYLIDELKKRPDPLNPSANLFDSTVISMCSTMKDGSHTRTNNIPFIYAGGRDSGLQTGKVIALPFETAQNSDVSPLGKALLTVAQAAAPSVTTLGKFSGSFNGILK